jgi:hypothetical protein
MPIAPSFILSLIIRYLMSIHLEAPFDLLFLEKKTVAWLSQSKLCGIAILFIN